MNISASHDLGAPEGVTPLGTKPITSNCTICRELTEVRHFDLYVIGSEGVWLCQPCEIKLCGLVSQLMTEANGHRKERYLEMKRQRDARVEGWPGEE